MIAAIHRWWQWRGICRAMRRNRADLRKALGR